VEPLTLYFASPEMNDMYDISMVYNDYPSLGAQLTQQKIFIIIKIDDEI
jgi:hypothetical protein